MFKMIAGAAALMLASTSSNAAPVANGDNVTCVSFDYDCSAGGATIGSGTEFTLGGLFSADFSSSALVIRNITANVVTATNSAVLFSDTTNPFTTTNFASASGVTNFDQSNLRLNSGGGLRIQFSPNGTVFQPGGSVSIALAPTVAAAVPEPGTWATMILGVGLMAGMLRFGRRSARVASAA